MWSLIISHSNWSSPHGLEDQAEVVFVEEVAIEPHHMEPVIRVCLVQLLKNLHLLKARLVPVKTNTYLRNIRDNVQVMYMYMYMYNVRTSSHCS